MTGLLRAELLKVTSVRTSRVMVLCCLGFVVLQVVALVFASGQPGVPSLRDPATVRSVYAAASAATALVMTIGILGMTTEYRHQTVTPTFLATPRRSRVLVAKTVALAAVGLAVGVLCSLVVLGLATALLTLRTHAAIPVSTVLQVQGGVLLAYTVYAVLGVSYGALVRNQIAAIVSALLWTGLAESLLVTFLPEVGRWLPGGAAAGLTQTIGASGAKYLPVWGAALLLLGYGTVFALVAARTTLRRDIT